MKFKDIFTITALGALVVGCADDKGAVNGEGQIMLEPTITVANLKQESRAASDELAQRLSSSFGMWLATEKGVVREYKGLDNVPSDPITLTAGAYTAIAWAGDSVSADWESSYYKGSTKFQVTAGNCTPVTVECKIQNVVVSIVYDSSVDDVLYDKILTVQHSRGQLDFDDEHNRGFFMMPFGENSLSWTLTGKKIVDGAQTENVYNTNQKITVQSGHEYIFRVSCESKADTPIGGGWLKIEIDDTEINQSATTAIVVPPYIIGFDENGVGGFDIDKEQVAPVGEMAAHYVEVGGTGTLQSVVVTCEQFNRVFPGGGTDFDAVIVQDAGLEILKAAGIELSFVDSYFGDSNTYAQKCHLCFSQDFFTKYFTSEAEYTINITASIQSDYTATGLLTTSKDIRFRISNNVVEILSIDENQLYHNKVTLQGSIVNEDGLDASQPIYFQYRKSGDTSWTQVAATVSGTTFSATVTGLAPGTEYQYNATAMRTDGKDSTTNNGKFTTDAETQLPNSSFEDWQTSSSPYLVYASGGEMFWDTGNHGSSTMSKNVTVPDDTYRHSGNYSIKLASQFVGLGIIGKFAAGNVFVGKYLKTDGTDGILGFGRPFTSRPAKLKGYMRYEPGTVDYTDTGAPDIVKGELDKGIIYMALLDGTTENYDGDPWPVIIKTKSSERQLFDKDGSNVIAYGELVVEGSYGGDGMAEFSVSFDYKRPGVRPSYIMLTCAASKGGDYFAGSSSSTMWIDDLELVYE